MMKRFFAIKLLLVWPLTCVADFAPPHLTPTQKATAAGLVLVGKIVEVEKDTVTAATLYSRDSTQEFTMVTIKITEGLVGCTGLTQVRLGIAPLDLGPRRGTFTIEGLEAKVDYVGCFFLTPHPTADFMVCYPWAHPLPATGATYDKQLAEVRKIAKIIDEPVKALQARDPLERGRAAIALLTRYHTPPLGQRPENAERVAVSAEESKLLLNALKELPWDSADGISRAAVWYQLRLTEQDGWKLAKPLRTSEDFATATSQWLEQHSATYRVTKIVPGTKKK